MPRQTYRDNLSDPGRTSLPPITYGDSIGSPLYTVVTTFAVLGVVRMARLMSISDRDEVARDRYNKQLLRRTLVIPHHSVFREGITITNYSLPRPSVDRQHSGCTL